MLKIQQNESFSKNFSFSLKDTAPLGLQVGSGERLLTENLLIQCGDVFRKLFF